MRIMSIYLLMFFIISSTLGADCKDPKNDFDGVYCMTKVYLRADDSLNEAYQEIKKVLTKDEFAILKGSQFKWIEYRNKTCSFDTSQGFFINFQCATEATLNRTRFLNERYYECITTGCDINKLSKVLQ